MARLEEDGLAQDENESRTKRLLRKMPGAKYVMNQLNARKHNSRLDEQSRRQENQHMRALQDAKLRHDNIRSAAEAAQAEYDLQQARRARKEQRRQELKRQKAIEAKRLLLDQEQQQFEQQVEQYRQLEAETEALRVRREAEQKKAELRLAEQLQRQEEADRQNAQRKRELQEQHTARTSAPEPALPQPEDSTTTVASTLQPQPSSSQSAPAQSPPQHQQYLALHQRLKAARRYIEDAKQQYPQLKKSLGDLKRSMRSQFSKFTSDQENNRGIIRRMQAMFAEAERIQCPTLNVLDFIIRPLPDTVDKNNNQVPGIRIYLLNIMAKALVQKMSQIGSTPAEGQYIGLSAVIVLTDPNTQWQGVPLTDIALAKLHKTCPVLFGASGDERTPGGRAKLGWPRDPTKDGPFVSEQRATEKWTGMGSVFAALTLRQFNIQQVRMVPFPPQIFWECMAKLLNTPPAQRTQAHYFLVKALIEHAVPNIVKAFGQLGVSLMRTAVLEYPKQSTVGGADFLRHVQKTLERQENLVL